MAHINLDGAARATSVSLAKGVGVVRFIAATSSGATMPPGNPKMLEARHACELHQLICSEGAVDMCDSEVFERRAAPDDGHATPWRT